MKKQLFIFSQNVKKWMTISHKSASLEYFDTLEISELPKYFDDLEYSDVSEYSVSFFLFLNSKIFAFIKYVLLLLVIAGLAGGIQSQKNFSKVT